MKIYQANLYRLSLNMWKILPILGIFFSVILYLIYFQSMDKGEALYQIYITMITFFWVMYLAVQNGDLFEKNVIRYYVEAEPRRYNIIVSLYLEYTICYIISVIAILALFWLIGIEVSLHSIMLYFLMYLLYLSITLNLLLFFRKTSTVILAALLILWIFPNLVNYVFENTSIYQLQLAYYLAPDPFITSSVSIMNLVIYGMYLLLFIGTSVMMFEKAEL